MHANSRPVRRFRCADQISRAIVWPTTEARSAVVSFDVFTVRPPHHRTACSCCGAGDHARFQQIRQAFVTIYRYFDAIQWISVQNSDIKTRCAKLLGFRLGSGSPQ